jgi:hypothetical protein
MAGVAGFEPANAGIKSRCLTTWRHPSSPARCGLDERPYNERKMEGNVAKSLFFILSDDIHPAVIVGGNAALNIDQPRFQLLR